MSKVCFNTRDAEKLAEAAIKHYIQQISASILDEAIKRFRNDLANGMPKLTVDIQSLLRMDANMSEINITLTEAQND